MTYKQTSSPITCNNNEFHAPHCLQCNGPVDTWLFQSEDDLVLIASSCKNGCWESEPCDGGLLSRFGTNKNISQEGLPQFLKQLITRSKIRPDRCLHDPDCEAAPIQAHTTPRGWLNNFGGNQVYLFRPNISDSFRPPDRQIEGPSKVSKRRATTSKFCCGEHDRIFNPVDSRSSTISGHTNLNLLFYRALLCRLHGMLSNRMLFDVLANIGDSSQYLEMNLSVRDQIKLLFSCCLLLKNTIARRSSNWRIEHVCKFIKGKPAIACSGAADWVSHWKGRSEVTKPSTGGILAGAWGISVVPKRSGHMIVLHYCTLERNRRIASHHLNYMATELNFLNELEGDNLAVAVSKLLLALTEDLCVSTQVWESFSDEKKDLIVRAWSQTYGVSDGSFSNVTLDGIASQEEILLNLFT